MKTLKVGRDPNADIQVKDKSFSVSRVHALLHVQQGKNCLIEDNGSRNGTFVNGIRLKAGEKKMLQDGD
ncbi:MAG: FHA domain-containing protein, partial [Bacteroidota bacterium]